MLREFIKILNDKGEVYLRIKVSPQSPKNSINKVLDDGTIKIDICAKPEKGKANYELMRYLSKLFEVENNNVKIISGNNTRLKLIKLKK